MGIYSNPTGDDITITESSMDELLEMFAYDDILHMGDEAKHNLLETAEGKETRDLLCEKGLINKTAIVKLTKTSDMDRREIISAYQLARDSNDPLWKKFLKGQQMKMDAREGILRKYHSKAAIMARTGQRAYLKKNPMTSITIR